MKDRGFTSIQFLIASSLALVFFLALANVVVVQFSTGALRSALDQGARVGSLSGSPDSCESRISDVLVELLGGEIGDSAEFGCAVDGATIRAFGSLRVTSFTPLTGEFDVDLAAEAVIESGDG